MAQQQSLSSAAACPAGSRQGLSARSPNVGATDLRARRKMEMSTFNLRDGYPEAILRGYKGSLLDSGDYALVCQCENLDDLKMHLASTAYGSYLSEVESGTNTTSQLIEACTNQFVEEFERGY